MTAPKRVFILGESAAFGFPLAYADSFAAQIEPRLKARGDAVLNAAETGWSSGLLVALARRIVEQFQPETLIVYMGNNEWVHWFPADEVPSPRRLALLKALSASGALALVEYLVIRRQVDRVHGHIAQFDYHHQLTGFDYALHHPLDQPPANWPAVASATSCQSAFESSLWRPAFRRCSAKTA